MPPRGQLAQRFVDRCLKALGLEELNASTTASLSAVCEPGRQAAGFHLRRHINRFGLAHVTREEER